MDNRSELIKQFIQEAGLSQWAVTNLPVDASRRRYLRLKGPDGTTKILMDAPPGSDCRTHEFQQIAKTLTNLGYSAPEIIRSDIANGLLIISDLGPLTISDILRAQPSRELELLCAAVGVLTRLELEKIDGLETLSPGKAGNMVNIAAVAYAQNPTISPLLQRLVTDLFQKHCGPATFLSLRDVHSENLIWRENEKGDDRCGLLDFQDAFYAPQGYDLISLLRDVRREIADDTVHAVKQSYVNTVQPQYDFDCQFACLAIQRNLRILGIFANLVRNQHKLKYLPLIERTWRLVQEDLAHPEFEELRQLVNNNFPKPNSELFQSWQR